MTFEPTNRHLLVIPIHEKEEESESAIILPDDYKKPVSPYSTCEVISVSTDSKLHDSVGPGDVIVIENRMLQKIKIEQDEFYLVLDNYVLGRVVKWN